MKAHANCFLPFPRFLVFALVLTAAFSWRAGCPAADSAPSTLKADEVLKGLRTFFENTAREDGTFQPGVDPDYQGLSDSASSDLAPTTYAVILHKTFGWKLPNEEKTCAFFVSRQQQDG